MPLVGHESSGSQASAVAGGRCPAGRAGGLGARRTTAQAPAQCPRIVLERRPPGREQDRRPRRQGRRRPVRHEAEGLRTAGQAARVGHHAGHRQGSTARHAPDRPARAPRLAEGTQRSPPRPTSGPTSLLAGHAADRRARFPLADGRCRFPAFVVTPGQAGDSLACTQVVNHLTGVQTNRPVQPQCGRRQQGEPHRRW